MIYLYNAIEVILYFEVIVLVFIPLALVLLLSCASSSIVLVITECIVCDRNAESVIWF